MTRSIALVLPDGTSVSLAVVELAFNPWLGPPPPRTYGPKPVVEHNGRGVFAEIAFAGILRDRGWEAVWASTYAGLRYFTDQPLQGRSNTTEVPPHIDGILREIAVVNGMGSRPSMSGLCDVVAWRGGDLCFYELKRSGKDRIRETQRRWLWAALRYGVGPEKLRIVEWRLRGT